MADTLFAPVEPAEANSGAALVGKRCGDYDVLRPLGEGGMGFVYEGVQQLIGKRVAVKVLKGEIAFDPEQMQRLLSEARTVNAIRHRGIVDIFNAGKLEDGRQYLVMEMLEGTSLDKVVAETAPMTFDEALPILDEVLDALGAAHRVGVIHRDLKPSNIFLCLPEHGSPYVKLLDFGLAKQAPLPHGSTPQTRASMLIGTPSYMAPEQARGQAVGPTTDLYALGIIIFEMLSGRLPFIGPTPFEVVYLHLNMPAPRLSSLARDVPPAVDDLVARLLAKDTISRPPTCADVRSVLRAASSTPARVPPLMVPTRKRTAEEAAAPLAPTHISKAPENGATSALTAPPSWAQQPPGAQSTPSQVQASPPQVQVSPSYAQPMPSPSQAQPAPSQMQPQSASPSRAVLLLVALGLVLAAGVAVWALRPQPPPVMQAPPPEPVKVAAPKVEPPKVEAPAPVPAKAAPASLSITASAPCELTVDGKALGKPPKTLADLEPGAHHVSCRTAFGGETSQDVTLAAGEKGELGLKHKTGTLSVWVIPFADVWVDGKAYGETPLQPLDLLEGTHRVELHMEKKKVTKSVVMKAGQSTSLRVNMEAP
jgi:serine/threonine-protein kinase